MKRVIFLAGVTLALVLAVTAYPAAEERRDDYGFRTAEKGLSPLETAGAELWYKATAGTARFTTYVFQQRMGVMIDWWRVLRADQQGERFKIWGLIHDPGCCTPGSPGCPAQSPEETYGFEWCPGDDQLLAHVGKTGYRDPGCDFVDPDSLGDKQNPCDLEFGTSTGALGFRKFPNPRFNAERWRKLNGGSLGTWDGYARRVSGDPKNLDSRINHIADGSIEPPFLIGMACGACHIAFDPLNPPKDPSNPAWENLKGGVGNQYVRSSEIMASGMPTDSLEWQLFSHERPGTVDTSAIPNDIVHNPGTMNAIISFAQRPTFAGEKVMKWRKVASCAAGVADTSCWCEPGKPGKCWERSLKAEAVPHVLKGGEDSVGLHEAIQRVYFNIGSCSEECWLNHLTDFYQLDRQQRNFGQTPFDIGQCRRDCAGFRAIEDRLPQIAAFFLSRQPTDFYQARGLADRGDLEEQLDGEYGAGAVARGRVVFAQSCARCHSSQSEPFEGKDFLALQAGHRVDWLGNDKATPASEVGTYRCRALHQNHMKGHVWEEYASETYRERPGDANLPDETGGGRGYYRNISLINAWAYAPFLHNNAIGPEVCGKPSIPGTDLYRSPYVEPGGFQPVASPPSCWPYDPSVEGRYELYKASMDQLLNPGKRGRKVSLFDEDIRLEIGPRTLGEKQIKNVKIAIPKGLPGGLLVSFQYKPFVEDLVLAKTDPARLEKRLGERLGSAEKGKTAAEMMQRLSVEIVKNITNGQLYKVASKDAPALLDLYATCTADVENGGHTFGEDLSPQDKKALTAFVATL